MSQTYPYMHVSFSAPWLFVTTQLYGPAEAAQQKRGAGGECRVASFSDTSPPLLYRHPLTLRPHHLPQPSHSLAGRPPQAAEGSTNPVTQPFQFELDLQPTHSHTNTTQKLTNTCNPTYMQCTLHCMGHADGKCLVPPVFFFFLILLQGMAKEVVSSEDLPPSLLPFSAQADP